MSTIISDWDPWFQSGFWKSLQEVIGTQLKFSVIFYTQKDGQCEQTTQILEDMMRACELEFQGCWEDQLPLIEFAIIVFMLVSR